MKKLATRLADFFTLVQHLPHDLPEPEVTISDDGDFELDWYASKDAVITVLVRDGYIIWAGINGLDSSHGSSVFTHTPKECLDFIRAIGAKMSKAKEE